jgi:hypothetical protein
MRAIACLTTFILPSLLLLDQSPAKAAAANATFFACKNEAIFKKAFEAPAGKAVKDDKEVRRNADAYFKGKVAAGDCLQLARGQTVTVDERHGDMWCVRLAGGLDCYWTTEKVPLQSLAAG